MKNKTNVQSRGRTFRVTITETCQRTITVYESELKEPTMEEAVRQVEDWWNDSQIMLTTDDFVGVKFTPAGETDVEAGKDGADR